MLVRARVQAASSGFTLLDSLPRGFKINYSARSVLSFYLQVAEGDVAGQPAGRPDLFFDQNTG